jgi:hypothetical protein
MSCEILLERHQSVACPLHPSLVVVLVNLECSADNDITHNARPDGEDQDYSSRAVSFQVTFDLLV